MKRWNYSIQHAMVLVFSLITLGVISSSLAIAYRLSLEEMRAVSVDYVSQLVSQVNGEIDRYMVYMEDVAEVVSKNASVHEWLSEGKELSRTRRIVLEDTVQNQMSGIINTRRDITNIAVFGDEGRIVFDTRWKKANPYCDYEGTDWYREARGGDRAAFITSSHVQNLVDGRYDWVVTMSKPIPASGGVVRGLLMIDLNYSVINNLCQSVDMGNRGYLYVLDRDGGIIYHPRQQLIYSHIKSEYTHELQGLDAQKMLETEEGNKLFISNRSPRTGWTVVGVAYQDEILRSRKRILPYYVLILLVFLLVGIGLSAALCTAITKPLKRLIEGMKDVQAGGLDTQIEMAGPREVAQLSMAFNKMTARLKTLIHQRETALEQRRESELKALQAQINPHFLYNTLDSIIWMAENNNTEEVVEITAALARLFRSSVSEQREIVPLRVEIANIRSYLTIQQMRYGEKLRFSIEIPAELEEYPLPKLLLQPLVENAIYHGIKPCPEGGEVKVSGWRDGDEMILEITDNGVGIPAGKLRGILSSKPYKGGSGIGVKNVNERIKLTFGQRYGLVFTSAENRGTTVRIVLPNQGGERLA